MRAKGFLLILNGETDVAANLERGEEGGGGDGSVSSSIPQLGPVIKMGRAIRRGKERGG